MKKSESPFIKFIELLINDSENEWKPIRKKFIGIAILAVLFVMVQSVLRLVVE